MGEVEKGKYSELPLRIASAIVLAAFALLCTWLGGKTFELLAVFLSAVIFYEFQAMVKPHLPYKFLVTSLAIVAIIIAFYFLGDHQSGLILLGVGALVLGAWEWLSQKRVWGSVLLIYAAAPFIALVDMRAGPSGFFIILFVFACVWGADTFAYFAGKTFGGPKLAPNISPNKTWSGFLGGLLGAIVISALLELVFGYTVSINAVFLAILLALFSQLGDLFESWIKRKFGLKDSGKIIPGHGGLLDRIDGLIFAIAAAWMISYIVSNQMGGAKLLPDLLIQTFFV